MEDDSKRRRPSDPNFKGVKKRTLSSRPSLTEQREAQVSLKTFTQRLSERPTLSPGEVHSGFILLSEFAETAMDQAITNGITMGQIHDHLHEHLEEDRLATGALRDKVDNLSDTVSQNSKKSTVELAALRSEVQELCELTIAIADHFGVRPTRS